MTATDKTLTVTVTADTWPFRREIAKAWQSVWALRIARRPIVGRLGWWWALLWNTRMRRDLRRIRHGGDR